MHSFAFMLKSYSQFKPNSCFSKLMHSRARKEKSAVKAIINLKRVRKNFGSVHPKKGLLFCVKASFLD
jgi:hypothetical protein